MEPGDLYQPPFKYTTKSGKVRWKYRIYLGPNKRPFFKGFRTKAEAERDYQARAKEIRRGVVVDRSEGRRPLSQWQADWEKTNQLAAATRATGISAWAKWVAPRLGDTPIRTLTAQMVQTWITEISEDGAGVPVQKQALAHLRRLIELAIDREAIAADPTQRVRVAEAPGVQRAPITLLSPAHVAALIAAVPEEYRLLVEVLAVTGMRQGEAFALTVGDLDLDRVPPQIWVRASWSPHGGGHLKAPKTNKARVVVLPADTAARLAFHTKDKAADDPVFTTVNGCRINSSNFRERVWLPAVDKVRAADPTLPDRVRVHELRHFYATTALVRGVDLVTVSKQLGHSATAVTADTYARWVPSAGAAAATAVSNALAGASGGTGTGGGTGRGHLRAVPNAADDDGDTSARDGGDDDGGTSPVPVGSGVV